MPVFIGVVSHNKKTEVKSQLLNFLVGEAKVAINVAHRDKLQEGPDSDIVTGSGSRMWLDVEEEC